DFTLGGDFSSTPLYLMQDDGSGSPMIGTDHPPSATPDTIIAAPDVFQSNSVTIPGFLFTANDADDDLAHNVGEQLSVDLAAGSINGSHTFGTVAVDNG